MPHPIPWWCVPLAVSTGHPNFELEAVFLALQIFRTVIMPPTVVKWAISVAFVRPSVCPSVAYIANNSRNQRPSVPKFGMKIPHLRCDSHTSFMVKSQGYRRAGAYRVGRTRRPHCLCYWRR